MKRLIIGLIVAATSIYSLADNIDLSEISSDKITPQNVEEIFAAAYAETNVHVMVEIGISKAMPLTTLSTRLKGNDTFITVTSDAIRKLGDVSQADKIACFNDVVDTWLAIDDNAKMERLPILYHFSKIILADAQEPESNACAKIYASESAVKINGIVAIGCNNNWQGSKDRFTKLYKNDIKDAILNDKLTFSKPFFANACVTIVSIDGRHFLNDLIKDVRPYVYYTNSIPFILTQNWKETRNQHFSNIRKAYLQLPNVADAWLIKVANVEDKYAFNKETTASIWVKLSSASNKLEVANYLNDTDKTIDSLLEIDDTMPATAIAKAVETINSLDPEYRKDDVLKALRVINKRYTLKLYDDRDTWEPILSKVRALIDVYQI